MFSGWSHAQELSVATDVKDDENLQMPGIEIEKIALVFLWGFCLPCVLYHLNFWPRQSWFAGCFELMSS